MTNEYQSCLETLGLAPGASQQEIKRAYFRLVRTFPPEKEPEQFQLIRHAYEALKEAPPPEESAAQQDFPVPEDLTVRIMAKTASVFAQSGDVKNAAHYLNEALELAPDDPYLLLRLARLYYQAGKPRKAAKTAQQLEKAAPQCAEAYALAATGFFESGWYKKAYPEFQRAYSLGLRIYDFVMDYASAAASNGDLPAARRLWTELLRDTKWDRDNIDGAYYIYCNLAEQCPPEEAAVLALLEDYEQFTLSHKRLIKEPNDDYHLPAMLVWSEQEEVLSSYAVYRKIDSLLVMWSKLLSVWADGMQENRYILLGVALSQDAALHGRMWGEYLALRRLLPPQEDPRAEQILRLDYELRFMKRKEESRKEAALIREKYPFFDEQLGAEIDGLLADGNEGRYERKKREYAKLTGSSRGGRFYEEYPEERVAPRGVLVHDDSAPFVRQEKKAGRNDPCPCGSGKKFKKCCIGKGIYD